MDLLKPPSMGGALALGPGFLLYFLKGQMLEDLFDYILMFYEGNNPHGPLVLWPDLSKGSGYIVAT